MASITEAELKRQALAMGAPLTVDGKTFNAGKAKIKAKVRDKGRALRKPRKPEDEETRAQARVLPHTPLPPPIVAPPVINVDLAPVAESNKQVAKAIDKLAETPKVVELAPAPIKEWKFTFERDGQTGLIKEMTATAT